MILTQSIMITARLLPGVMVDKSFISIEFDGEKDGRVRYRYYIDTPDFEYTNNDLCSGVGSGTLQQGLSSLLSFLCAVAEGGSENRNLFPGKVARWAAHYEDELGMLQCELEESELIKA